MEFSQILGCTEEYSGASGSESGWTNYIASPIKENDFDDDNADSKNKQGDCRKGSYGNDDGGGESDDSLTSDASSGPSHPEIPCRSNEGSVKTGPSKYATGKYSSKAKHQKKLKERDGSARIRVEKEVSVLSAASYVQSRTKVKYMHEYFITSSSWKNEIQGMHPDTVYDSGRREALLILRIKENGSIRLVPSKTLIISTCNGSRTEIFSFSSPEHQNLNLPPVFILPFVTVKFLALQRLR
ncbi:pheromone-processing carboxypeptidase KEX [Salix suchowensis]|nr:pheromone-processing carboxypeptidase KEX [Salix suchowensis]